MHKRGQLAIFVIVAIVIVAAVVLFFVFRDRIGIGEISAEFLPVYNYYSECIQQEVEIGSGLMSFQGGRIAIGDYEPASNYAPFSSHLDFFGSSVEYWYYISGNGLIRENSVSINEMERELEEFLNARLSECNFDDFYQQGFYIQQNGEIVSDVTINENSISVEVISDMNVLRGESSARKTIHNVKIDSKLGGLYNEAKKIYDKELTESFLGEYAVDVLRLYAPVDGVEVSCAPQIWKTGEVANEIKQGLSSNFGFIKFEGDYYSLNEEDSDYFVVDEKIDEPVRFMYMTDWPSKIEIYGDKVDDTFMIAEPIGNQEGLDVLGFCYVPYHFVYDVAIPVMVQVGDGIDIFQFPIVVVIDNNLKKHANLVSVDYGNSEFDLCEYSIGEAEIYTFDTKLNPVEADISFECLDQRCSLGRTEIQGIDSVLKTDIPQCLNGNLVARAEGFADKGVIFSSNNENVANIILEREYEIGVNVKVDGANADNAIVYFIGEGTETAVLPEKSSVKLKEGNYKIDVYVYGDTGIVIPASEKTQCVEVSRGGVLGLFGVMKEECFDIEYPETKIENALRGGGKTETYILENELESGLLTLEVQALPSPDSLEQLQLNYELFNNLDVGVVFG